MKKLNKKQKLTGFIAILLVAIILAIVIITRILSNNSRVASEGYSATTANANSNLVANYIKKGITIGGITGTLESLNTFDATATPEDISYGKTAYVKGEKITGTYRTLKDLEIGDYVAYTPDNASAYNLSSTYSGYESDQTINQENLNWRLLSKNDDETVNLVSETPTTQTIGLGGSIGYNNGVYFLNDIAAKLYSNSRLGVTARSLKIEDVEAGMTQEGLENVHEYTVPSSGVKFGQTKTYTSDRRYYPNIYAYENGSGIDLSITNDPNSEVKQNGVGKSDSYYNSPTTETYTWASKALTVTQTFYGGKMSSNYYENSMFCNMIYSGDPYWLASRYVHTYVTDADFGFTLVDRDSLDGYVLFYSQKNLGSIGYRLKPVVLLNANVKIGSGDGKTPETACQLLY